MAASTMTSKGQVTIPKEIRDALGLGPGDRVRFYRRADGSVAVEPETIDVRSLAGSLRGKARTPVSLEAMDDAVAAGAAEGVEPDA